MNAHRSKMTRRTLLRATGACLALPLLESLQPRLARGATPAAPPLRMAIVTVAGGTVHESWKPEQTGSLAGVKLPSILRSLEFAKDELLLLSGLSHSGRAKNVNAHAHCAYMHLTGASLVGNEAGKILAGVSVDQVAASQIGDQTMLPSLEIGLSNTETQFSFRDAHTPVPFEANPNIVYERMFRGRRAVVPNWKRRAAGKPLPSDAPRSYDQGVIDLILAEAKDLRRTLGSEDRRKLDDYLFSVRSIERRIERFQAKLQEEFADLNDPGPSTLVQPQLPDGSRPFHHFKNQIGRDPERHGEYIRIMSDLMVLAFQTDTTRVITLALGDDGAMFPGVVTVGSEQHCHTLEHLGGGPKEHCDPIAREAMRQILAWYTETFAETVRKLREIDEGGSSLLDNCMLLYTSYMAHGGHGTSDYPALLIGKAGGTLKTGRHLAFPENTPMSNLYLEMLERMQVKVDSFGESHTSKHAAYDGRLPGLRG